MCQSYHCLAEKCNRKTVKRWFLQNSPAGFRNIKDFHSHICLNNKLKLLQLALSWHLLLAPRRGGRRWYCKKIKFCCGKHTINAGWIPKQKTPLVVVTTARVCDHLIDLQAVPYLIEMSLVIHRVCVWAHLYWSDLVRKWYWKRRWKIILLLWENEYKVFGWF